MGGFHVGQVVAISLLMLAVRTIINEASMRRDNGRHGSVGVSTQYAQMDEVEVRRRKPSYAHGGPF